MAIFQIQEAPRSKRAYWLPLSTRLAQKDWPALVRFRRTTTGWDRYVIEDQFLTVEAGGAAYDMDGEGDLDMWMRQA